MNEVGYWDRRREKRFASSERKARDAAKKALGDAQSGGDDESKRRILAYASWRSLLRKSLPQILLGLILGYVEYRIIGFTYTVGSALAFVPIVYLYTKSLRAPNGVYLMEISAEKGTMEIWRYLIPVELWGLMKFDHPLVPGTIRMNGHDVYLATKVHMIEGTNLIHRVQLAWFHFNQLEYARNREVLEKAVAFATQLSLENAELEKMREFLAVAEGKRQKRETLALIDRAYRDSPDELRTRISELEQRIDFLVKSNTSLLFDVGNEKREEGKREGAVA